VSRELEEGELQEAAASFPPIPLAVLDREATLATRSERKYILDESTFWRLLGALMPHYLILEIDGARVFPYDTVYFDTPEWTTYRQHLQGRRRRFKCRTRLYPASELCFFEVKLKGRRGETIKRRLEVDVKDHGLLTRPALAFLEHELNQAYGTFPPAPLAPVLRTSYRRLTLAGRTGSERLTFDFGLTFTENGKDYSIEPGRVLFEAKTAGGVGEANRLLRRIGVRPLKSCSKYCLGSALAHPDLTDNPFRPLIRHHFNGHAPVRSFYRPPAVAEPRQESQSLTPIELVRQAIEAHNRGDVEGVRRYVHEDAESYRFLVLRGEAPFNGLNGASESAAPRGVSKWLANGAKISEQIDLESLDLVAVDDRVLGFGRVTLIANGRGLRRTVETAWVWETREGKISYMGSYLDPKDAFRAVASKR
jgi:ketosteroid isomerase-like protein